MFSKFKIGLAPFTCLNFTQFFSALNDNVYKLLLAFFLISVKGVESSNTILALAGGIFVFPFLLFASTAGTMADRFPKRNIIIITRLAEVFILCAGVFAFAIHAHWLGYTVLFLMATQSALFSPCKFGIIPELVKKEKVSRYNGFLSATTYLAIIIGTFFASFLADVTKNNFILAGFACVVIAALGLFFSFGITKTKAQDAHKKVSAKFFVEVYNTLKKAKKTRYLLPVIAFNSYFLFFGAYTQLNIIPFVMQSLHLTPVEGGYLFLMTALGIGVGSYLAGRLSGNQVELGFPPLAGLFIGIVMVLQYAFAAHFYVIACLLALSGLLGGFYIVPMEAYIQVASPSGDRGENVAAANFLSFTGAIFASVALWLLGSVLGLSAAAGFLIVGAVTIVLSIALLIIALDQVLRLLASLSARFFWNFKVEGNEKSNLSEGSLLVAERTAWVDTFIVMAALPRMLRYIVPIKGEPSKWKAFLYKLLWLIPVETNHLSTFGEKALTEVQKELNLGHSVCLMLPVKNGSNGLKEWESKLSEVLKERSYPTIPIYIERPPLDNQHGVIKQFFDLKKVPIALSFGEKKSPNNNRNQPISSLL